MMSKRRKKKLPGHYCWVCKRCRANEKFSGRGHAWHICKDCERALRARRRERARALREAGEGDSR